MATLPPVDLQTTTQVADRLRVSPKVVRRYATEGRLPVRAAMPGGRGAQLFAPADVERLAAELAAEAEARAAELREVAS